MLTHGLFAMGKHFIFWNDPPLFLHFFPNDTEWGKKMREALWTIKPLAIGFTRIRPMVGFTSHKPFKPTTLGLTTTKCPPMRPLCVGQCSRRRGAFLKWDLASQSKVLTAHLEVTRCLFQECPSWRAIYPMERRLNTILLFSFFLVISLDPKRKF